MHDLRGARRFVGEEFDEHHHPGRRKEDREERNARNEFCGETIYYVEGDLHIHIDHTQNTN